MPAEAAADEKPVDMADGDARSERPETPDDVNIAMRVALTGNVERLVTSFESGEDKFHESVLEMLNERNDEGKSPLDMAATLGRTAVIKEMIARGVEVNDVSKTGYSALHRAAAWGKIDSLKLLVSNGGDIEQKTKHGERPREIALRYNKTECVDFLDWAEAKQALIAAIATIRETLADPEKVQGRLTRDDKVLQQTIVNHSNALCAEKDQWLQNATDPVTQDFITQKQQLDQAMEPIWIKLSEPPPEKPEKK